MRLREIHINQRTKEGKKAESVCVLQGGLLSQATYELMKTHSTNTRARVGQVPSKLPLHHLIK